jgi:capsular exopolysaccharide synthesis family protein
MGEIADALRRAKPVDPPRTKQHHGHVGNSEADRGRSSRPPVPEAVLDIEPQAETAQEPIKRSVLRLSAISADASDKSLPARICLDDPQGHFAQQYRRLAVRLRGLATARHARSIVITSSQAGEGKTTTACNLAIALAMTDHDSRVVLVDLDIHRVSIASALDIQVDVPIEAVLRGEFTLEQATMETDVEGLFILAGSSPASKPDQLLAGPTLAAMIPTLESRFDWVIIDTPPILATSDAQVILQHAATSLLVVRAGVSPVRALHNALDHLPRNKVLASFLNSSQTKSQQHGYYYGYYRNSDDLEPNLSNDSEETDELDVERS